MKKAVLFLMLMASLSRAQTSTPSPLPAAPTDTPVLGAAVTVVPDAPTSTPTASGPVLTPTKTSSPTKTFTPNLSLTPTPTESPTLSPTATPSETSTNSPTGTPSPTPTATSTPGIGQFILAPKPLKGKVKFSWENSMKVDQVNLKVFTSSFRMVRSFQWTAKDDLAWTEPGAHEVEWDVTDDRKKPLVPGTYFFFLTTRVGKTNYSAKEQAQVP